MRYGRKIFGIAIVATLALAAGGAAAPDDPADLAVTKSDSPDPVQVGQVLTYTVQVRNEGPDPAVNTSLTDKLPGTVEFVSASGAGTCKRTGNNVRCELGTINSGDNATVRLRVRPRKEGSVTNTASARSNTPDPNDANNEATATTQVIPSDQPTCLDHPATIVGTQGNDTIVGTGDRDVIVAKGGDDEIRGRGSRDLICAGGGEDVIYGGAGNDRIKGGAGKDRIRGRGGSDTLRGNGGNDRLRGNRGADVLVGGNGNDRCWGGPGKNILRGCE